MRERARLLLLAAAVLVGPVGHRARSVKRRLSRSRRLIQQSASAYDLRYRQHFYMLAALRPVCR
jgi:hypothetical protein